MALRSLAERSSSTPLVVMWAVTTATHPQGLETTAMATRAEVLLLSPNCFQTASSDSSLALSSCEVQWAYMKLDLLIPDQRKSVVPCAASQQPYWHKLTKAKC
eukprot:2855755-Amphidinium_carterae.1